MTSMLCHKQPGGHVKVHDGELIEDLIVDSQGHITTTLMSRDNQMKRRVKRPSTTPSPTRNMDSQSLIGQTMKVQQWLNEKTLKTLQIFYKEKSDLESKAAKKLYSPLLQAEDTFVKDVGNFIDRKEVIKLRKKEVLHKKWNERVYKPLRKKILDAMDGKDWTDVDRRRRELHKQYLEFTNEKGHVFLDTMDPEEYYAMALNGHRPAPIKRCLTCAVRKQNANRRIPQPVELSPIAIFGKKPVETRPLLDPLISQGRERNEEERTILRCLTGYRYSDRDIEQVKLPAMPLVPLGRHGTDSIRWLEMPLSNIESTPRVASRKRMYGIFNTSQVDFDQWSKLPYDPATVDKELALQKKRLYSDDQKPPFTRPPPPKMGLKPDPYKSVSFYDEVNPITGLEPLAVQKLNKGLQQVSIGVGTD